MAQLVTRKNCVAPKRVATERGPSDWQLRKKMPITTLRQKLIDNWHDPVEADEQIAQKQRG